MSLKKAALALLLVSSLGILAACSARTGAPGASSAPAAEANPAVAPTVKIVEPASGSTVPAGSLTVSVGTTGLEYVMPSNTNVPGEGHVHFTLDGRPFEMSTEPGFTFKDVEPGPHKLVAELVQNNTQPFDPPVKQEVLFTVE